MVVNPTFAQVEASDLELIVAGTSSSIMMVEGEAKEVSEEVMLDALRFAQEQLKKIVTAIKELAEECAKPKMVLTTKEQDQSLLQEVKDESKDLKISFLQ